MRVLVTSSNLLGLQPKRSNQPSSKKTERKYHMGKTILLVEDDKNTREFICDYLESSEYEVIEACDGAEAVVLFEENKDTIDLVVLDIMMPRLDGFAVCKRIRSMSDTLIIILSAKGEEEDNLRGFKLGADEYVTKPFSPRVLVARVDALMKRRGTMGEDIKTDVLEKGDLFIDKDRMLVRSSDEEVVLTAKEYGILVLLAENEGIVFSRMRLIDRIWGEDFFGEDRIIDVNINTLRKKLGDCSKYIKTIVGMGYKFEVKR